LAELARVGGWGIGFSIGVATFSDDIPELVEALRAADTLMYQAKRAGESCVVYEQFSEAPGNS
jgi:PleD family two-component response regulator